MNDSIRRIAMCFTLILFAAAAIAGQDTSQPAAEQTTLNAEQLESMVAPIALYPDSLLSQVLVASTYPLEVVEAQQWLDQNKALSGRT